MASSVGVGRNDSHNSGPVRRDWDRAEAQALYGLPFAELMFQAQSVHHDNFDPNRVETASLLSIKTGGCPEDCGYCSQSAHYNTGLKATRLMERAEVVATAQRAKGAGATRFCMAAAWRSPKDRDLDQVCDMVSAVKGLGMETCVTLGMLTPKQAATLAEAGLDFYNHNVDTSPDFYGKIITTRTLQDRIDTLAHVRDAGIKVCCGGIVGMGERVEDRLAMLVLLANLPSHPESVPINLWNEVKGVPVNETAERPDPIALVRLVAVARIMMPKSVVRLSAGRQYMTDELQALCFLAGANSIFIGDVLLTTKNPQRDRDANLMKRLGIKSYLSETVDARTVRQFQCRGQMQITLMKGKVHRASVTEADLHYEGSISIDRALLDAAGFLINERVEIYNIDTGARFATYVIEAPPGSGVIGLNGAAARLAMPGDKVIIVAYASFDEAEAKIFTPRVVLVDRENRILPR